MRPWQTKKDRAFSMRRKPGEILQRRILFALAVLILGFFYELRIYYAQLPKLPPLEKRTKTVTDQIDPEHFSFAVVADNRNDKGAFPRILEKIQKDREISFVIHLGDAVMAPRKVFYLDLLRTLNAYLHKPFFIIPGNHDIRASSDYSLYEKAFGPRHYWFGLGKLRFIMADSICMRSRPKEEMSWLKSALSRGDAGENTLVFMHIPLSDPRGKGYHHCLSRRLALEAADMFQRAGVQHVFSGHIHGYWSGLFKGLPYSITGGGGAWLHSRDPAHGFYHYLKIRVQGNEISQEVIQVRKAMVPGLVSLLYYSNLTGMELIFLVIFAVSAAVSLSRFKNTTGTS